ncbi:MAG: MFS transporter, partial [Nitrosopumilus sp.]|nr:MFS transporter [Nitrosopumilus sp.]
QLDASAYPEFGFTFALLMGMAMLSSALGTKRHIRDLPTSYGSNKAFSLVLAWQDFKCVFSNRLFFILFISALLVLVMRSIQATLGMHINTFFWQLTSEQIQWIVLAGVIGLLSGMPFARLLNQRFERKSLFISGLLIFIFFQNMPIILRMLGWLALQQTQLLVLLLVSAFISGVGVVQFMIAGTAMFSDISDAHEIENNLGQQAMFFAGLVFLTKVATGMGHLIAGVAIDWIAFPIDANPGDVGESTLMQLAFVFGPGATLIGIIAFFTLSRYSLPRAKVLQNQKHLESIRTGE